MIERRRGKRSWRGVAKRGSEERKGAERRHSTLLFELMR